ncbi:nuclear transport factor 2 family protein [Ilumatobacter coccineus]|uniref:SnoaL-like domain-containing protein n=1 Tax=Ilumatobacter coccineus (strain NBRC 103263 / KCTC 29153 / YM16-304) TaxID=1313172 RepID=A0A6C7EA37_ILUCY|nr:nuclear transport factor 2 family protein [Ilumatobacter coccineus]BAN03250.1 hypothetical protein YM304_29360 [Ilumatobacter coccineus YM16-304]
MTSSPDNPSRRSVARRAVIGGGGAALVAGSAAALLPSGTVSAGRSSNPARAADELAIRQLSVNYALGTDAIGAGDIAGGRALYEQAFTAEATIAAGFDRAAPALVANGRDEWADVVIGAFQSYSATQHLLGTINITIDQRGRSAQMTSYLEATHVLRASQELLIVKGTYIDTVESDRGDWRITERFLQFMSYNTVPRTLPAL